MKAGVTKSAQPSGCLRGVRTISLFAGCGGSDYALHKLGANIVWANDIWEPACETYRLNIPSANVHCGDITDFDRFPSAQLLVGCYPCQGFTQGGRRNVNDSINFLYREYDRVLRYAMPKAFVAENVNGMAFGDNHALLSNQLTRFRMAGYRVKWATLNAQDYGVAQSRRRVFIVGIRSDIDFEYEFPSPTHGPAARQPYKSQRRALKGLPVWPAGEFNDEPFHWYYLSRNRRADWEQPSPCIVGHWRHVPLHPMSPALDRIGTDEWRFSKPGRARRFSFRECAALQGFARSFRWTKGSVRQKFQMIGNAVPPPLFKRVVMGLQPLWRS